MKFEIATANGVTSADGGLASSLHFWLPGSPPLSFTLATTRATNDHGHQTHRER